MEEIYVDFDFISNMRYSNKLYNFNDLSKKTVKFDPLFTKQKDDIYGRRTSLKTTKSNLVKVEQHYIAKYLKKYNFILAGGAIHSLLHNFALNDLDIFIIGRENIKERIIGFIREIKEDHAIVYATKNCITITNDTTVQIILRIYNSIVNILNDFDVANVMMGFDGENVYLNEEGKFINETDFLIIDLNKYNHTYIKRLTKYNYNIIHTNLKPGEAHTLTVFKDVGHEYLHYYDKLDYDDDDNISNKTVYSISMKKSFLISKIDRLDEIYLDNLPLNVNYKSKNIYCKPEILREMERLNIFSTCEINDYIDYCVKNYGGDEYDCGFNVNGFNDLVNKKIKSLNITIPFTIEDGPYTRDKGISIHDFYGDDGIDYNSDIKIALK